jgi:hypothetical protein
MRNPRQLDETIFEPIHTGARFKVPDGMKKPPVPKCKFRDKHSYKRRRIAEEKRLFLLSTKEAEYLRVYKCTKCKYWHLTHKKPRSI